MSIHTDEDHGASFLVAIVLAVLISFFVTMGLGLANECDTGIDVAWHDDVQRRLATLEAVTATPDRLSALETREAER